jgi:putative DNA primase/helicase
MKSTELSQAPRFIIAQYVALESGKMNKIPLHPKTLKPHDAQDPTIHRTYAAARTLLTLLDDSYTLGFAITSQDNYFFIDLDNCLQPNGQWTPLALDTCQRFAGAYVEISQSKRGLHIIGKYEGQTPEHTCRDSARGLELYTSGRFVALTEYGAQGNAETIHTRALHDYIKTYGLLKSPGDSDRAEWTTECASGMTPPDNATLIHQLLNAKKSASQIFSDEQQHATFKDLFENNEGILAQFYPSVSGDVYDRSRADSSIAYRLHYWLGGNCERVQEIMQLSQLKRDKWEREDYLPRTILSARGKQTMKNYLSPLSHKQSDFTAPCSFNQQALNKFSYPRISSNSKVLDIPENLQCLLDAYGVTVRWNTMSRLREIALPGIALLKEDEQNATLAILEDIALFNELPIIRIDKNLDTIAQRDAYHPIVEGLAKNPWDGLPRLERFISTVHTENDKLSYKLIKRWLISAMAAAHSERGFAASGVLVLSGAQNIGKTRFIKSLDPFDCCAVKEGAILDPSNKDNILTLASHWIIELGELDATFRKADIARLKSHLTNTIDIVRAPYARKNSYLPRRSVYAASVNDSNFLIDETGNRRWWTIPTTQIDFMHDIDIAQVWAEVYHIWQSESQTWLTTEEFQELNDLNEHHTQLDPFREKVEAYFDFSDGYKERDTVLMTASDVLTYIGYTNISKGQATRMGAILIKMTGSKSYDWRRRYALLKRVMT